MNNSGASGLVMYGSGESGEKMIRLTISVPLAVRGNTIKPLPNRICNLIQLPQASISIHLQLAFPSNFPFHAFHPRLSLEFQYNPAFVFIVALSSFLSCM